MCQTPVSLQLLFVAKLSKTAFIGVVATCGRPPLDSWFGHCCDCFAFCLSCFRDGVYLQEGLSFFKRVSVGGQRRDRKMRERKEKSAKDEQREL